MPALPAAPALELVMRLARPILLVSCPLLGCLLLAGCAPPKPPDEERRPDPQAGQVSTPKSAIVRSAEAYKDRARSAEQTQLDAADQQRADIDAQTQ